MLIYIVILMIFIVVILYISNRHQKNRTKRSRSRLDKKKSHIRIATDSAQEAVQEHINNPRDPLVLIYNRPDVIQHNKTLRQDVINRMRQTILDEHFNDIETLERIVHLNEEFDLDQNIAIVAPAVAIRTVVNNPGKTFDDRITDVQRQADDPQNVHDSAIIKQLNETLREMLPSGSTEVFLDSLDKRSIKNSVDAAIDDMLKKREITNERANAARIVASKMISSNDRCMSYDNRRENDIFKTTWANAQTDDQKHNFILGLADAHTAGNSTVCMNGRLARIIGANTSQVSSADIKSAVYSYAGKIMTENKPFADVEKYIDDIAEMPESQKTLLKSECKAVFDENMEPAETTSKIDPLET